jgi:hypothetical protein
MATDQMQIITHPVDEIRIVEGILTVVAEIPTAATEETETATLVVITTTTDLRTLRRQLHQHHLVQPPHQPIIQLNTRSTMLASQAEILTRRTEAMQTMLPTTNTTHNSRLSSQGRTRLHRHLQVATQLPRLHPGLL